MLACTPEYEPPSAPQGLYFTFNKTPIGWRWAYVLSQTFQTFPALCRIALQGWAIPETSCGDDIYCLVSRSGDGSCRSPGSPALRAAACGLCWRE